jgi:hypothetical protein
MTCADGPATVAGGEAPRLCVQSPTSMALRRSFVFAWVSLSAALVGCEPSLMPGDWSGRPNAAAQSSGGNGWTSPRWNASNPQPSNTSTPAASAQPSVAGQGSSSSASAVSGAPWGAQSPPNATVTQGGATVAPQPTASSAGAGVCEDSRPRALEMPGERCASPCRAAWQQCFDRCNAGQDRACVANCDDTYRDCMRGCY